MKGLYRKHTGIRCWVAEDYTDGLRCEQWLTAKNVQLDAAGFGALACSVGFGNENGLPPKRAGVGFAADALLAVLVLLLVFGPPPNKEGVEVDVPLPPPPPKRFVPLPVPVFNVEFPPPKMDPAGLLAVLMLLISRL